MYMQSRQTLLAAAIGLALASGASQAASASQEVTEARQETQIWTTYALSPYLRANDLKVAVHSGKATLSGKVEEDISKDLAKQIALGVSGIKEVDNQIIVQADYVAPAHAADRSYGEVIDDATITSSIKSKLLWSKYTSGLTTNVETKLGKVTLIGTADSAEAKELAGRIAMNTRNVIAVDNMLVVKGLADKSAKPTAIAQANANAKQATHEASNKISDSWITAKVKSTYAYSSNVNGSSITVNTKGGIVTLSGMVDSGAERALAIELAQNVRGVDSVQSKGLTLEK